MQLDATCSSSLPLRDANCIFWDAKCSSTRFTRDANCMLSLCTVCKLHGAITFIQIVLNIKYQICQIFPYSLLNDSDQIILDKKQFGLDRYASNAHSVGDTVMYVVVCNTPGFYFVLFFSLITLYLFSASGILQTY